MKREDLCAIAEGLREIAATIDKIVDGQDKDQDPLEVSMMMAAVAASTQRISGQFGDLATVARAQVPDEHRWMTESG